MAEWSIALDCKSGAFGLRRFKSFSPHKMEDLKLNTNTLFLGDRSVIFHEVKKQLVEKFGQKNLSFFEVEKLKEILLPFPLVFILPPINPPKPMRKAVWPRRPFS